MKKTLEKIELDDLVPFTQDRFIKLCLNYFDAVDANLYDNAIINKLNHRLHVKKIVLVRLDEKMQELTEEYYKHLHKLIGEGLIPNDNAEYLNYTFKYSDSYDAIKKRIADYPITFEDVK